MADHRHFLVRMPCCGSLSKLFEGINPISSSSGLTRVAVVYQGRYPERFSLDAGLRRICDLARGLASAGVETTFISPDHFGAIGTAEVDEFLAVRVGHSIPKPTIGSRRAFWSSVAKYVTDHRLEGVIFYNTTLDSLLTMRQLRRQGVTVAFEICDLLSTIRSGLLRKSVYKISETYLPRQSSLNLTISTGIRRHLELVAPNIPAHILPGLFDCNKFIIAPEKAVSFRTRNRISLDAPLFAYCGSWLKIKGLETMLRAWKILSNDFPEARLVVTGCHDPSGLTLMYNAQSGAAELGIRQSVLFPGFLDDADLTGLLNASDVVLCPHEQHEFADYAFPTKVAEYAGMGRAIIATDVGDISMYLKPDEEVLICPPGNVAAIEAAMRRLIVDLDLRHRLGRQAAIAARKHFDYRANGERLAAILSNHNRGKSEPAQS